MVCLQRSAALKIDWAKVTTSLGLRGQTAASLQSFKKRNDDARRKVQVLSELPQTVNFDQYRQTLKNQAIVDELENHVKNFKPATYDVDRQVKAIDAFESQALKSAEETKGKVETELQSLAKTLENIETARPFDELTVVRFDLGDNFYTLFDARILKIFFSFFFRMRLLLLNRRSMRRLLLWSLRASGCHRVTRFVQIVSFSCASCVLSYNTLLISFFSCRSVSEIFPPSKCWEFCLAFYDLLPTAKRNALRVSCLEI